MNLGSVRIVKLELGCRAICRVVTCKRGYPIIDCETQNRAWWVMTDPPSYFLAELRGYKKSPRQF